VIVSTLALWAAGTIGGAKVAVTLGVLLEAVSAISPAKPVPRLTVTGTVVDAPAAMLTAGVPTATPIVGVGIVSDNVAPCVATPLPAALTVIVCAPGGAVGPTATCTVLAVVAWASNSGSKVTATPLGTPSALRVTAPV
jgi:hypothetical protein